MSIERCQFSQGQEFSCPWFSPGAHTNRPQLAVAAARRVARLWTRGARHTSRGSSLWSPHARPRRAAMASVQYDDSAFYLLVLALLCMYLVPGARSRHPPFGRLTCWFAAVRARRRTCQVAVALRHACAAHHQIRHW